MFGRWLAIFALSCALLLQGVAPSAASTRADGSDGVSIGCRLADRGDAPADAHHSSHCKHCVLCATAILAIVAAAMRLAPFPPVATPAPAADRLTSFFIAGRKPPSHAPPRFS
ncbi:hypothetical+protein [Methylocapsa aurea]|jgi:hypothetical protein|uniref:DUF2946 family protein n=1 Tax=Methylocapsa aurea TaxID=663610 RepID=UPI003D18E2FC